ncbi:MAG TPA: ABC transporter permease [Candidatus Bathyarchaeia archaeon]|nr:ABC transporter permease [Candidatus Bathyarchaeia archaeon]
MYFFTLLKVAMFSLLSNKLRSFLAVLGIIIGVGAVIAMLAIADGAKAQVLQSISAMGTQLLVVRPGQHGPGGVHIGTQQNLKLEDAEAIVAEVENVQRVAPVVQGRGQVKYYENNASASLLGTSVTFFPIRAFELDKGRLFSDIECELLAHVAILGPVTVENLMGQDNPIGAIVKINGMNFQVIGVTKAKGDQGWYNPDDQVIVPYTTAMKQMLGVDYVREIDIQCKSGADLNTVQDAVTTLLRRRHRILPEALSDFEIRNQAEIIDTASEVTRTFTILLGAVAGISLLVGGIGIMNIMLVTVTERTREIGVRKAIGAKNRDILRQFLFESIFMSALGGLLGVAAGVGAAKTIGSLTVFTVQIQPQNIVLAIMFACGVGIFFGYYPARRAAKLNPIEALRYE